MWKAYFSSDSPNSGRSVKKTFDKKEEERARDAVQPEVEDLWGDQGVEHPPVLGDTLQPGGYVALSGADGEEGDDGVM